MTEPLNDIIWARRKTVALVAGITVAVGIAYTLIVPPVWEAKATLMFANRTSALTALGGLSEAAGLSSTLMGGPTPLKIFGGILKSERTLDIVTGETKLDRRDVRSMRDITDDTRENSITISARDTNPELAKKVVALHISALKKINADVSSPLFNDDTAVLAKRIAEQQAKITSAENQLLKFQKSAVTGPVGGTAGQPGGEVSPAATAGRWTERLNALTIEKSRVESLLASAESLAKKAASNKGELPSQLPPVVKWREKLTELEYELQIKSLSLASEAPEIKKLKAAIGITRQQMQGEISRFMSSLDMNGSDSQIGNDIPALVAQKVGLEAQIKATSRLAAVAPQESIELTRLLRELSTRGAILQQLQAQYELSAVQAARNPNKWEVLDDPRVDDRPVNKGLVRATAASLFLGLFLGSAIAVGTRKKRRAAELPSDQSYDLAA